MKYENLCIGCMAEKGTAIVCPICGYREEPSSTTPLFLAARTLLKHRYIIGRVLGSGGFGVTYLAWDLLLQIRVAVKEFLPCSIIARLPGTNRISVCAAAEQLFSSGRKKFIEEARALAQFNSNPAIVSVQNYFQTNNTAYLVMEYLEGMTFKAYLERQSGGKLQPEEAVAAVLPVIAGLREVHAHKLLHRDISPDNIFMTSDRRNKLIDFGAARYLIRNEQHGLSVLLKRGYTPWEQYSKYGKQGPWTDVYAMGATLYRAITGQIPEESFVRVKHDNLLAPSQLVPMIDPALEQVVMKALAVDIDKRYQSMAEFQAALEKAMVTVTTPEVSSGQSESPSPAPHNKVENQFFKRIIFGIGLAVLLHLVLLLPVLREKSVNLVVDGFLRREAINAATANVNHSKVVFVTISPHSGLKPTKMSLTPRDQIAEAVQNAVAKGAKIIYLDFQLNLPDERSPQRDAALRKILKAVTQKPDVRIILLSDVYLPKTDSSVHVYRSIVDDLIDQSPNIYRAEAGIVKSDGVVRYWREYEKARSHDKSEILWGVPLLTSVLAEGNLRQLQNLENPLLSRKDIKAQLDLRDQKTINLSNGQEDLYWQQIRFTLIPKDTLPDVPEGNLGAISIPAEKVPYMRKQTFENKIVIIGNPKSDFGDIHRTPVGKMAGMYVVGNAIDTLLTGSQVNGIPFWTGVGSNLLIIIIMACFCYFLSKTGSLFKNVNHEALIFLSGMSLLIYCFYLMEYFIYHHYNVLMNTFLLVLLIGVFEIFFQLRTLLTNFYHNLREQRRKNAANWAVH
jgi:serine/threonine protein kinase